MYVKRILIEQMINLFTREPEIRDDRMKAISRVVNKHYKKQFGKSVTATSKLLFDIDRSFRYIQQHIPELRGRGWSRRQMISGEISKAEYEDQQKSQKQVRKIFSQMQLF